MNVSAVSSFFQCRIDSQKERHLYRQLRNITGRSGALIEFDGRQIVNFSSNDYLGLSLDPSLAEAAADAARRWGTGSGASRLVSGSCEIHNRLEKQIAELKEEEAALLYPSGFQANLGLLSAVAEKGDTIFADRLSHASLIDAARLSEASLKVYPHADFETLERRLERCTSGKKIVVTDSYFSMDGDVVNLAELAELCSRQGAYLIVDEAHSNGVFGPRGAGLSVLHRVQGQCMAVVGTFSKAFGSQGGFVAGSGQLREFLINHSRAFIYSTGVSPAIAGASSRGVSASVPEKLRTVMHTNVLRVREALTEAGYDLGNSTGPIIPVLLKGTEDALNLTDYLLSQNILAPAIRPPTVPKGTDRIRITVTAAHSESQITQLIRALKTKKGK